MMALCKKIYRAFTLVEVMGAVTVVSALAVLAVVSTKDMVLSGQRSAVQRELQMLNGALQQFRAAGGVIPDDASAAAAVRKLREGVGIEGGNYAPLTTDPKMNMEIGGEPYELSYDPDPGFSYVNADGEGMGLAGGELTPTLGAGAGAGEYPFDITDPLAIASALDELDMLDPDSPEYQDYLNALGAAMSLGGLGEDAENLLRDSMDSRGYVYDPDTGTWGPRPFGVYPDASHLPPSGPLLASFNAFGFKPSTIEAFLNGLLERYGYSDIPSWAEDEGGVTFEFLAFGKGYSDPALDYFNNLGPLEQTSLYRALLEEDAAAAGSMLRLLYSNNDLAAVNPILTNLPSGEAGAALNSMGTDLVSYLDLSGLNLSGWDTTGKNLFFVNFAGSNVTAEQLNGTSMLDGVNLSGLDLTGWVTTGKSLGQVNLVGSNVTAEQLNAARDIYIANLSGLNLSGWDMAGKSLWQVNLSSSNVTSTQLNEASDIRYVILSGTGITRADLEASGKWSSSVLNTITF